MSTVCQVLRSCLEPRFVEPRTVRLKLALSTSNSFPSPGWLHSPHVSDSDTEELQVKSHNEENNNKDNSTITIDAHGNSNNFNDLGGWSFLQVLNNTSQTQIPEGENEKESLYVHPLAKRSSSTLGKKSLEMCTENLGCETGTEISENSDFYSSSSESESVKSPSRERAKLSLLSGFKKANCRTFPPPLTSMSGSDHVQVRPHREGGRLVIKAVSIPSFHAFFHAERGEGRLRLRFLESYSENSDTEEVEDEEKEEDEEQEEAEEDEQEADEKNGEQEDVLLAEEIDGNKETVGGETGIQKLDWPSRCMEGRRWNTRLLTGEPLWVATS